MRKVLLGLVVLIVILVIVLAILVAIQRKPAIDGSGTNAGPLPWWTQKLIQGMFDYRVWSGSRSGYIAMFAHEGEIVYATTAGYANVENEVPMTLDTRLRVASITKPVTAVAAMILVEEERMNLDDPVAKYIPAVANLPVALSQQRNANGEFDTVPPKQPMLVRHLLMMASGIGGSGIIGGDTDLEAAWKEKSVYSPSSEGNLAQRVDAVLTLPLMEEAGTRWRYGNSADVLARVIEIASGQTFGEFLKLRIFEPLKMDHTGFLPPPGQQDELARVYTQNENGKLKLMQERIDEKVDWESGGGGLVSTVGDYMRLGLMMRNNGSLDGVQILKPETVAEMTRPHIGGVLVSRGMQGMSWGLGMAVVDDAEATPTLDQNGDYWWAGYYGTYWSVSPQADLVSVVFSQFEPGPYTDAPVAVHLATSLIMLGL